MTNCFNTRLIKFLYTRSCGAGGGAARGCRRGGRPGGAGRLASSSCGQMFFVSTLPFPRTRRGGAARRSPLLERAALPRSVFPGRS